MDAFVRRWRFLLSLSLGLTACGAGGRTDDPVGVSSRPKGATASRTSPDGGVVPAAPALPNGYRATFVKVNQRPLVTRGHVAGRWSVEVYANEPAVKALASRSRDVPIGAMVVAEHFETQGAGGPGPVMLMEKRDKGFSPEHGDWRYAVVNAKGQVIKDGTIDTCAGCHDDSPMDGLFPIVE